MPDSSHNPARIAFIRRFKWDTVTTFSQNEEVHSLAVNDLVTQLERANISCTATITFGATNFKDQLQMLRVISSRYYLRALKQEGNLLLYKAFKFTRKESLLRPLKTTKKIFNTFPLPSVSSFIWITKKVLQTNLQLNENYIVENVSSSSYLDAVGQFPWNKNSNFPPPPQTFLCELFRASSFHCFWIAEIFIHN